MNEKLAKLNKKIAEIESLKTTREWGPEYQLWLDLTEGLVKDIFGEKGFKLFNQQHAVVLDRKAYERELDSRKKILEGLLANQDEYPTNVVEHAKPKRVGVHNLGKNNTFIGNTFHGHDVGILDEGEGTNALANEFYGTSKRTSKQWYEKPLGILFLTILAGIVIGYILFTFKWN